MFAFLNILLLSIAPLACPPQPVTQQPPRQPAPPAERAPERPRYCMCTLIELPPPPRD